MKIWEILGEFFLIRVIVFAVTAIVSFCTISSCLVVPGQGFVEDIHRLL